MLSLFANMENPSKRSFSWETDFDVLKRPCDLHYITRSIQFGTSSRSNGSNSSNGDGGNLIKHVGLYFEWDDRKAVYEAFDVDGWLIPCWFDGSIEESADNWNIEQTYHCHCSPAEVNSIAKNLPISGVKYNVLLTNCFYWARQLASQLGVDLGMSIWTLARDSVCMLYLGRTSWTE